MAKVITEMEKDYSQWYTDVVTHAELADYSPVKGCMVIRPYGYAIWEKMKGALDDMIKETGHENAYFPLFIPESFISKEGEHVEGFSPQLAVVTHGGGKKLEEPLVIRPTSETIMYSMYSKWINSWRDLPVLINQWANVVRWEMRTRLFIRTTEFLWQEGHTAHATLDEAEEETLTMLEVYRRFAEDYLATPVIKGLKSEREKFAGALRTYCVEALMQDGKALQAGTSHNLGQNFSKPFNIRFQSQEGRMEYVWQTSWGVSTRLIGAVIMAHGDNKGLVVPPRIAPIHAVVIPIWKKEEEKGEIMSFIAPHVDKIREKFTVKVDDREGYSPGWKFNEWEMRGVPLRLEVGPRDMKNGQVMAVRRDTGEKFPLRVDDLAGAVAETLDTIQSGLFEKALKFREDHTSSVDDYEGFRKLVEEEGGFIQAHWCGGGECEEKIQEETKATIRCIAFDAADEKGKCVYCGSDSPKRVLFAKAY